MILGLGDCHLKHRTHNMCMCGLVPLVDYTVLLSEECNIYFFIMMQVLKNKNKYETGHFEE